MPTAKPTPGSTLLTPTDHTLIMIDFQSQMAFATRAVQRYLLKLIEKRDLRPPSAAA